MLTEIAITPQILDAGSNSADTEIWRESLRQLAREIFPRHMLNPVIISDLCAGKWFEEATKHVNGIGDQNARYFAQSLLKRLDGIRVSRPDKLNAPCDEDGW